LSNFQTQHKRVHGHQWA